MIRFDKLQGIGNDFVLIEQRDLPESPEEFIQRVCHRVLGVGADGVLVHAESKIADTRMRMFNPDGSESEMCGNGLRCFVRWLHDKGHEVATVETKSGVHRVQNLPGLVQVEMGKVSVEETAITVEGKLGYRADVGNPHFVIFEPIEPNSLGKIGPKIECDSAFPNRTNVHFVQVASTNSLVQMTWERGAGITHACGSGACACVAVAQQLGFVTSPCEVILPGGRLSIDVNSSGVAYMTGPTAHSFSGFVDFAWQ